MNTIAQPTPHKPWYKQFWPWFLIALPSAAVIASFITLYIAITKADQVVQDNYEQHGLTVLHKPTPKAPPQQAPQ
ncbi:MAG TPA: FixH family protein [Spongiibacteraceae bacterium]|nr:FixH family protein [Spongiibacteraceae bacterium]